MLEIVVIFWFAMWVIFSAPTLNLQQPNFRYFLFYTALILLVFVLLIGPIRLSFR